jgi:hypothetical protein
MVAALRSRNLKRPVNVALLVTSKLIGISAHMPSKKDSTARSACSDTSGQMPRSHRLLINAVPCMQSLKDGGAEPNATTCETLMSADDIAQTDFNRLSNRCGFERTGNISRAAIIPPWWLGRFRVLVAARRKRRW